MDAPQLFVCGRSDRDLGVFVRQEVKRGDVLFSYHRCPPGQRDLRAIPMEHGVFLRSPGDLHCLIHHRCVPTAYVDWENLVLRALRDLRGGDEVSVNFHTIYERVATPFTCRCGEDGCYGEIRGFHALSLEQKLGIEFYLSPYLKHLLNEQVIAQRAAAG